MFSNHSTEDNPAGKIEDHSEDTIIRPRFDENAVKEAKPVVPVATTKSTRSKILFVITLIAGLLGGVIGSILTVQYLASDKQAANPTSPAPRSEELAQANGNAPRVNASSGEAALAANPQEGSTGEGESAESSASGSPSNLEQPIPPRDLTTEEGEAASEAADPSSANAQKDDAELRRAFTSWLEATNRRDINRQMDHYPATVNRYYRARGASREDVRAEKSRVFERADIVSVEAGEPSIRLSPDGNEATVRFRKRYNIEGGGADRRGEVEQELRWRRVNGKWRIISERDIRVIR